MRADVLSPCDVRFTGAHAIAFGAFTKVQIPQTKVCRMLQSGARARARRVLEEIERVESRQSLGPGQSGCASVGDSVVADYELAQRAAIPMLGERTQTGVTDRQT